MLVVDQNSKRKEPKSMMDSKRVIRTKLLMVSSGLFEFSCAVLLLLNRKPSGYGWRFVLMLAIVALMVGMYYSIKRRLERYFAVRKFYWWLLGWQTTMATTLLLLALAMRPFVYQLAN